MSKNEIVIEIIKESMSDKNIIVNEDSRLKEDLGLCSFDMMVLIALLEENHFNIDVSTISTNATVKDLLCAIN